MANDFCVEFSVEPSDTSVGIMTEGFSAWRVNAREWCNLDDIVEKRFTWFDQRTSERTEPPSYAKLVEALLLAYAEAYYAREEGQGS